MEQQLEQNLLSSGREGPSCCREGWLWHLSVTKSLSPGNSIWSITHSWAPSFSDVPAGDKQLWQGQQLIPGPHSPESKGVAQGQEDALGMMNLAPELLQQPLLRHRGAAPAADKVMPWTAPAKSIHSPSTPWMDTSCPAPGLLCSHTGHTVQAHTANPALQHWLNACGQALGTGYCTQCMGYQKVGLGLQEIQLRGV